MARRFYTTFIRLRSSRTLFGYGLAVAMAIHLLPLTVGIAFGQTNQNGAHPYANLDAIIQSSELFVLWTDRDESSVFQKGYDYFDGIGVPDTSRLIRGNRNDIPLKDDCCGSPQIAAAGGHFNVDGIRDIAAVWSANDTTISAVVGSIEGPSLSWQTTWEADYPSLDHEDDTDLDLATGDLSGDGTDEFVIAYMGPDSTLRLDVFDTNGGLVPTLAGGAADERLTSPFSRRYAIAIADLNVDGTEDVAVAGIAGTRSDWEVYVKIYSWTGTELVAMSRTVILAQSDYPISSEGEGIESINLSLATGNFDRSFGHEVALGLGLGFINSSGNPDADALLYLLRVEDGLRQVSFDQSRRFELLSERMEGAQDLAAGDLIGSDGVDEVVFGYGFGADAGGGWVRVYQTTDSLGLEQVDRIQLDQIDRVHHFLGVGDVDEDRKGDLFVTSNSFKQTQPGEQALNFKVYAYNETTKRFDLKASRLKDELRGGSGGAGQQRYFAFISGDFDGDRTRFGQPTLYRSTDIRHPLVILNSPPIHFDVLNGTMYDLNNCFSASSCGFSSTYQRTKEQTFEVSTTIQSDYAFDVGLEETFSAGVVSIKASVDTTYGENFSRTDKAAQTFSIGVTALALGEDQVYASVVDYDVWEYPVFSDGEFQGYMVVTVPALVARKWFPSKSLTGLTYVPNHEVGNALSYLTYNQFRDNDYLSEAIRLDIGDSFTLGRTTEFEWRLQFSDFQESGATEEFSTSLRVGGELSIGPKVEFGGIKVGVDAKVKGSYQTSEKQAFTHITRVGETVSLKTNMGGITGGEDQAYSITPYAYWANNGALVLDFAVTPEIAPQGFPKSWWQTQYGTRPDPALILQWRYDNEKGIPVADPDKVFLTKEITFSPTNPVVGDTVTTAVRIHNYSLTPQEGPVRVRFFRGDPDRGGTPITGTNGTDYVETEGGIAARDRTVVTFRWVVPSDIDAFQRIYALVDPDDAIAEVHENNNKGFSVLGNDGTATEIDDLSPEAFARMSLQPNYPNPFRSATTIAYSIGRSAHVVLRVYDITGRLVATLVDHVKPVGSYSARFSADGLASGVYLVRLQANEFQEAQLMAVVR